MCIRIYIYIYIYIYILYTHNKPAAASDAHGARRRLPAALRPTVGTEIFHARILVVVVEVVVVVVVLLLLLLLLLDCRH